MLVSVALLSFLAGTSALAIGAAPHVLTIGECLWDGLPAGCFLGGAPLNVAAHLASRGARVSFAAAVGNDRLGQDALRRLTLLGVDVSCVQVVDALETGFVTAALDATGSASYTFVTPAAWDALAIDEPKLLRAASEVDALVFGTLSQRDPRTRAAVKQAVGVARSAGALIAYDVNLRPPYTPPQLVVDSCGYGVDLLKLNDEEVRQCTAKLAFTRYFLLRGFCARIMHPCTPPPT